MSGERQRTQLRDVPELLAPAGGPRAFAAALAAGADAIYCGLGNDFNARRGAENFTDETFAAACRAAHLAGARVYVTVNVVIRTAEMPSALALARRAWLLGADALIIQDWGLLAEVRRRWPQVECHISTQANVHDARGVAWCAALGATRVTLSRELSLPEISRIAEEGVELEAFGHGALCVCYSGLCLMSSLAGARSANRGMCAQPCRLLYELVDEGGRPLSRPGRDRPLCPKDLCTVDDLAALADAGLRSLKVEGRMKAPDYVHSVVSTYREALDDVALGRAGGGARGEARHDLLRRAFNRDFTDSYLRGASGDEMMSYERSNNRGQLVGRVVASCDLGGARVRRGGGGGGRERFRHVTRAEVSIALDRHVDRGDLLEIRPQDDPSQFLTTLAQADARAGETIVCTTTRPMAEGCPVRVIRSQRALEVADAVGGAVPRTRKVTVWVEARLGEPFVVRLSTVGRCRAADGSCTDEPLVGEARGPLVEPARTRAVTPDELFEHIGRMGGTPFEPVAFDGSVDEGVGMAFSAVHKVRAAACKALERSILAGYAARGEGLASTPNAAEIAAGLRAAARGPAALRGSASAGGVSSGGVVGPTEGAVPGGAPELCVLAPTAGVAASAVRAGATRVYATAEDLAAGRGWPSGTIVWLDEVCREVDHARLDPWVRPGRPLGVGNVSELALAVRVGASPEVRPCMPVHNASALAALEDAGAAGLWLSPELTLEEVCALAGAARVPVGLVVYGRTRAMTCEHCVLQVADRCVGDCARCALRRRALSLRDKDGSLLPVRTDLTGRSRIYAARPLDATPQVGALVAAGVARLMVDATLLTPEEAAHGVRRVREALRGELARERGATSGHLFSPID